MTKSTITKDQILDALDLLINWTHNELSKNRNLNDYREHYTFDRLRNLLEAVDSVHGSIIMENLCVFGHKPKNQMPLRLINNETTE